MLTKPITIINKLGLHARAAAKLAKTCGRFSSAVKITHGDSTVDGKSVMSLMLLAASCGSEIVVNCDGKDEANALPEIEALILDRFGEDE